MTITLVAIHNEHVRLRAMIAALRQAPRSAEYRVAAASIALAAGERVAGTILGDDGTPSHYLILLPASAEDLTWNDAMQWAAKQGGALPTRREQSLLFANLKHAFDERYYWSCEQHDKNAGWAWCQHFTDGVQNYRRLSSEFRARAVRRASV